MRRIYIDELKKIQINILDQVADFCNKNDISYWLDCGTLLGAVRHKGYIPWDDDVDIGMFRSDFDRFLNLFNQSNERYKVYNIEHNNEFYYPFGKVLDTTTILYEPDEKGSKISVNIDIFVYDNAPNGHRKLEIMYIKRDLYRNLNLLRTLNHKPNGTIVRRILIYFLRLFIKPFPKAYFAKKMVQNSKKYVELDTQKIGNFTGFSNISCSKKVFRSFVEVEFEGKHYKAPIGYDEYLKAFYNNYMELPPIEKQVSSHTFIAYADD